MKPFTIIVPVYNEEELLAKNIEILINYAKSLGVAYEIIPVSNGSTDQSEKIGSDLQAKYPQVKFFALPEKGVGHAFKKGIQETQNEYIIFMDADLSADLDFIGKANQALENNVMVLGTKLNGLQNRTLFRKIGSFVFYLSVLALMGMKYVDYAPGAKAYRRSFLVDNIKYIDDFTSFVLNLTFVAHVKQLPIKEISINCHDNRQSRFNLWHEAVSKYQGLLSLKIRQVFGKL